MEKKRAANPQLKFDIKVSDAVAKPMLAATYKDGKALTWQTAFMTVQELEKDFWRHSKHLQEEEEVICFASRQSGSALTPRCLDFIRARRTRGEVGPPTEVSPF